MSKRKLDDIDRIQITLQNVINGFVYQVISEAHKQIAYDLSRNVRYKKPYNDLTMRCRHPGCKSRSKGPRFKFLCAKHIT